MNTDTSDDPMDDAYWNAFETAAAQMKADRKQRDSLYGSQGDPGTGGWRGGAPPTSSADAYRARAQPPSTPEG